jgi:cysteine desulfurase family protein
VKHDRPIYFDHAATSWPKPPEVLDGMRRFLEEIGANPGRSGHSMSLDAARMVFETREAVAELFGLDDSAQVVFTANATHALNIALQGMLQQGSHVITTAMEHNSVIRPLRELESRGVIELDIIPCTNTGTVCLDTLDARFRPNTGLVAVQHGSNVTGCVQPIEKIGALCSRRRIPFLVDAAQTAGCLPIDMKAGHIDLLAFTGHKALLGPTGIGGLCIAGSRLPEPLYFGGTGSASEQEKHPLFMPDRLEAGTPNTVGIAGLQAALEHLRRISLAATVEKEQALRSRLVDGLHAIDGVRVYSGELPVVSFTIDGLTPDDIGYVLDRDYGIMSRVGLHCSPLAHRTLGTAPAGTVRFSMGYSNTMDQVDRAVQAVAEIAERSP